MKEKKQHSLSAQVVLKAASGKSPAGQAITSENIREYLPSQESVRIARSALTEAGFEVGNVVANSFSITAPAATFEKVFGARIRRDPQRGAVTEAGQAGALELPLKKLEREVAGVIEAVTFSPPPDFGPGNP
jgi:hypothetical protein